MRRTHLRLSILPSTFFRSQAYAPVAVLRPLCAPYLCVVPERSYRGSWQEKQDKLPRRKSRSSKVRKRAEANRNRRAAKQAENIKAKMIWNAQRKERLWAKGEELRKRQEVNRRVKRRLEEMERARAAEQQQKVQEEQVPAQPQPKKGEVLEAEIV